METQSHETIVVGWLRGKIIFCRTFNETTEKEIMERAYDYVRLNCDKYVMTEMLDSIINKDY